MWTNRGRAWDRGLFVEGGNCIVINLKSSVKSLAMMPQHLLDTSRNEVDRFDLFHLFTPGSYGLTWIAEWMESRLSCLIKRELRSLYIHSLIIIQDIYGKIPLPEAAVSADEWTRGAIEKPHARQLPSNSRGMSSLQNHVHQSEAHLLSPADMKDFIAKFRQNSIYDSMVISRFDSGRTLPV